MYEKASNHILQGKNSSLGHMQYLHHNGQIWMWYKTLTFR